LGEESSGVGRRDFLKIAATAGISFVIGAGVGYYAGRMTAPPAAPAKTEVVIGVIAPMATKQGTVQRNAAQLAIKEINQAGGILNLPVRMVVGDTKLNPDVATAELRRLVEVERADVLTGGFSSGIMLAMMEPMAELKIPFLADASSPAHPAKVHDEYDKYKYWFRITQNNGATFAWDLADMLDMLAEEGFDVSKIYIIRDEHIWTDAVMSYLQPELDKRNITIAKDAKVGRGYTEYEPLIVEANDMGVEVIVPILAIAGTGDVMVKQWASLELPVLLAGHDLAALDLGFYEATEGKAEGYIFLADGGVVNTAPPTEMCRKFIENYEKEYGYPPEAHQGYGAYDAVYLYKKVVEMAHDDGVENPFDPDVVVTYLEKFTIGNPIELTRRIAFYPKGDENKFDHDLVWGDDYVRNWISQWQGGKQYIIRGKLKNRDMILPPWF
jgi:branched-chain amino acid transport system substrate-binding protein